ncbi:hypothetical protein BDA96_06G054900 [Sorghum bicolor]|uniref:CCHC-type domain-containing protein n=2 Tax=Sorghum bicolor TaxID=4558 RepID=A0A921UB19_SORBI|nr:hypothetical protein BDA96_06G054900 [Sorghum bicolor]OQU81379.1 hypothetical protein SORBI_3006G049450 [Sorghum bicolor]
MAAYGLDVECPHSFDGTHFAQWRNWMQCNFMFISPQMWWMVDVGFSHVLDEDDLTQAQEKCLDLDIQATNIMYRSLDDCIFGEIIDMKTAHEIWVFLNEKYRAISDDDDDVPKVEAHEDVEHDHNTVVVEDCSTSWSSDDDDRSTTSSLDKIDDDATSDTNEDSTPCTLDGEGDGSCSSHDYDATTSPSTTPHSFMSHGDTKVYNANVVDHVVSYDELVRRLASMTMSLENEKAKTLKLENENSILKTTCEQQKHLLYVTTCSHEELKLTHEELCVAHDNLVKDYAFLTKRLSNEEIKTSESSSLGSNDQSHIVTNPCDVGKKHVSTSCDDLLSMPCSSHIDACSTSMSCETNLLKENNELNEQVKNLSNKLERCYYSKVTFEHILKTQRNYGDKCGLGFKKKMTKGKRKQEREKVSHFMCYRCHEVGHLANGCPNKEKLKKKKEEERLKHVKCFKCRTWGHLTSMCPTKQLVKQQEEPQPKPQVEQEKTPQAQVKINHDGDDLMKKKKKTRRGGRARHPMQIQDAKMMSNNEDKKKAYAHIKCFECKDDGHFASRCPTKLEKKAQATLKRQGNEKQHMSKEEKAQSKRSCYLCRERGHMAYSCPLGNNSKPISIDDNTMLRKDGNGTSMVAIAKHPATHTKAVPKYVAPNLRGPKLVWVPSKSG